MNIRDLDDLNIKDLLYDMITEKERIDQSIKVMREELDRRQLEREKKTEEKDKN